MADLTCSLEEAADICRIPGRTLWRWRRDRLLTLNADFEGLTSAAFAQVLSGQRALLWGARLDVEDLTRLLLASHLGVIGWDRPRLMAEALGHPWAVDIEPGREPRWLLIYPRSGEPKLSRTAVDTLQEVAELLLKHPTAYVANLTEFRGAAARGIAALEADRKRRTA
jgi:hypothetical protein